MQVKVNQAEKRSWLEIDLEQIVTNLKAFQHILPSETKMAVIKADAYGHGDVKVAQQLTNCGVNMFAVSNIDEAVGLRKAGVRGLILILGYTSPIYAESLYNYDLTQTIVSEEYAEALSARGYRVKCQFAIDTGMNRIGISYHNQEHINKLIGCYSGIFDINGLFTHLCVADSDEKEDVDFTCEQLSRFKEVVDAVSEYHLPYVHCFNTAGGLRYSHNNTFSSLSKIVRLGIGLYGLKPDKMISLPKDVKPAIMWKSAISLVKQVEKGEGISYGRTYVTKRPSIIATVTTGYADGYNRLLSNRGFVMIRGKKAPIVGRICMDQTLIDVTDIPDVKMGDIVVLMGESDGLRFDANEMAAELNTIGYEVICGISKRVQRFYL
jgi:alanine racemase